MKSRVERRDRKTRFFNGHEVGSDRPGGPIQYCCKNEDVAKTSHIIFGEISQNCLEPHQNQGSAGWRIVM
jgi:hypothetical protein